MEPGLPWARSRPGGSVTHHELLWGTYQEPHGFVTQSYTLAGAGRQLMGFCGAGCSEGEWGPTSQAPPRTGNVSPFPGNMGRRGL